MLRNQIKDQNSGAIGLININYLDEVSLNTQALLTTRAFQHIEWENYNLFEKLVNSFGVPIICMQTIASEWGQDFVKNIKINEEGNKSFDLITRYYHPRVKEEFETYFPNSVANGKPAYPSPIIAIFAFVATIIICDIFYTIQ